MWKGWGEGWYFSNNSKCEQRRKSSGLCRERPFPSPGYQTNIRVHLLRIRSSGFCFTKDWSFAKGRTSLSMLSAYFYTVSQIKITLQHESDMFKDKDMFKDSNPFRVIMCIISTRAWRSLWTILLVATFKNRWWNVTFSSKGENVWKTSHLEIIQSKKQLETHRQCVHEGNFLCRGWCHHAWAPLFVSSGSLFGSNSQQNFELLWGLGANVHQELTEANPPCLYLLPIIIQRLYQ